MENNDYSDVMILAKDVDLQGGWDTFWGAVSAPLMWTLLVGAILCAPDAILPLILGLLDAIANAGIALFKRVV